MFSDKDLTEIKNHDLTVSQIKDQIAQIKSGMAFSKLKKAATVGNGIIKLKAHQEAYFITLFDKRSPDLSMVKFVPASGAATRMFKFLFEFLNDYNISEETIQEYIKRSGNEDLDVFLNSLEKSPFFEEVVHKIHKIIPNFNDLPYNERCFQFVKTMLEEDRLNYSFYPKGLLPFHKYKNHVSTAFEEHLFEAAFYASSKNKASLHFTISETHHRNFNEELNYILEDVEELTGKKFHIDFSYQKSATDTIALTSDNELFRALDGSILFRPSGHGALLENLNELDYDIAFIKNIDNLVVRDQLEEVCNYRKILAGILLEIQDEIFKFLRLLDSNNLDENEIKSISKFLITRLNILISPDFESSSIDSKIFYLKEKLNRPIRVCSMVKNEGEPGGGPFWVTDQKGTVSLQIIEFAQIDISNPDQKSIVDNATHFNPTDLVCGIKNYKGEPFDLMKYVDQKAAFITNKTQAGTDIKALELPGLWNGSMAYWNSIFVEVPVNTFNPVKTVNDFFRSAHQVKK